jgi:hypothetical protein
MRRTIVPLVVAAALLVTGACSDDDDDGGGMFGGGANQEGDSGESGFPGGEDGGGFPGGEGDGGGGFPGGEGDGGGGGGYDEAAYSNFMDTCTGYPGASDDLCDCAFSEVVASVPYEEYAEFEAEVAAAPSTPLPGFVMDAVGACS